MRTASYLFSETQTDAPFVLSDYSFPLKMYTEISGHNNGIISLRRNRWALYFLVANMKSCPEKLQFLVDSFHLWINTNLAC